MVPRFHRVPRHTLTTTATSAEHSLNELVIGCNAGRHLRSDFAKLHGIPTAFMTPIRRTGSSCAKLLLTFGATTIVCIPRLPFSIKIRTPTTTRLPAECPRNGPVAGLHAGLSPRVWRRAHNCGTRENAVLGLGRDFRCTAGHWFSDCYIIDRGCLVRH